MRQVETEAGAGRPEDVEEAEAALRLSDSAAALAAAEAERRAARQGEVLGAYSMFGTAARRAARRWRLTGDAWEDVAAEAAAEALAGTEPVTAVEVGRLTRAVAARFGRRAEREAPAGDAVTVTGEEAPGEAEAPRRSGGARVGRSPRARMGVPHRADVYGVGDWSREAMRDPADVFVHRLEALALGAALEAPYRPSAAAERDAWEALGAAPVEALQGAYVALHLATYRTVDHAPGDVVRWRRIEWAALTGDRAAQRATSRAARGWATEVGRRMRGGTGWATRMAQREVVRAQVREHLEAEAQVGEGRLVEDGGARFAFTLPVWEAPGGAEAALSSKQKRNWAALEAAEDGGAWSLVATRDVLAGPVAAEDGAGYVAALAVPSVRRSAVAAATVSAHWEAALEAEAALVEWRRRAEAAQVDVAAAKRARQYVLNAPPEEAEAALEAAAEAERRAALGARFATAAEALAVDAAEALRVAAEAALAARRSAATG